MGKTGNAKLKTFGAPDLRVKRGDVAEEQRTEVSPDGSGRTATIKVHVVNDWLRRHYRKGHLSRLQYDAGSRFAQTCEAMDVGVKSQLAKLLEARGGSDDAALANAVRMAGRAANHARRAYGRAVVAMGNQLAPVAVWVIIAGRSAKAWAERAGKPQDDGIAALRLALDALVDHYGLRKELDR